MYLRSHNKVPDAASYHCPPFVAAPGPNLAFPVASLAHQRFLGTLTSPPSSYIQRYATHVPCLTQSVLHPARGCCVGRQGSHHARSPFMQDTLALLFLCCRTPFKLHTTPAGQAIGALPSQRLFRSRTSLETGCRIAHISPSSSGFPVSTLPPKLPDGKDCRFTPTVP